MLFFYPINCKFEHRGMLLHPISCKFEHFNGLDRYLHPIGMATSFSDYIHHNISSQV